METSKSPTPEIRVMGANASANVVENSTIGRRSFVLKISILIRWTLDLCSIGFGEKRIKLLLTSHFEGQSLEIDSTLTDNLWPRVGLLVLSF